jgi:hypothetical protein
MKLSATAILALAAFAASSTYASAARPPSQVSIHDFFQAIRTHDNRTVEANLSRVVTAQRDWDLAADIASGVGNSQVLGALFAMDEFHPSASDRNVIESFLIPGLHPMCSGLIGWALFSGHTDTALRLYGEPKCHDYSLPLFPSPVKYRTKKTKALTRALPLAIVDAARQGWTRKVRMLLAAKKAAERPADRDDELALAVNEALLVASEAGYKWVVEALLDDDDIHLNEYYEDAIAAAKAGNHHKALIMLLASQKHPHSAEFQADLKQLYAEEQELTLAAVGLATERVESKIAETRVALEGQKSRPAYAYRH